MKCCSITGGGIDVGHPPRPTIRPTKIPTPRPIPLYPVTSWPTRPTTYVPWPDSLVNNTNGFETIATIDNNFIQDDEGTSVHSLHYKRHPTVNFYRICFISLIYIYYYGNR